MSDPTHTATTAAHASAGLPQFDLSLWPGQIVWLLVLFTLFYVLLDKALLPMAGKAIAARRAQIDADSQAASAMQAAIDAARATADQALADARARGAKLAAEARATANADIASAQAKADQEMSTRLAASDSAIATARAKALAEIEDVAAEAAAGIVRKLAGLTIAQGDAARVAADVKA